MRLPSRSSVCSLALRVAALGGLLALGACSSLQRSDTALLGLITPYRVEVVQGNVVTKEQAELVKPGMNRQQVREVLGSPLLTDVFHANRWDYVFIIRRPGTEPQQRVITARFDGDVLKSIDTPALPGEREFVASIDTAKKSATPPVLSLTPEQVKALPVPAKPAVNEEAAAAPVSRSYPPLESR